MIQHPDFRAYALIIFAYQSCNNRLDRFCICGHRDECALAFRRNHITFDLYTLGQLRKLYIDFPCIAIAGGPNRKDHIAVSTKRKPLNRGDQVNVGGCFWGGNIFNLKPVICLGATPPQRINHANLNGSNGIGHGKF